MLLLTKRGYILHAQLMQICESAKVPREYTRTQIFSFLGLRKLLHKLRKPVEIGILPSNKTNA